jgi:hypothetical protein
MTNALHSLHALHISISHAREGGLWMRNKYRGSVKSVKLVKRREVTSNPGKAEYYQEQNEICARIIEADPVKHACIMQEWARLVLNPPAERTPPTVLRQREHNFSAVPEACRKPGSAGRLE